MLIKPYPHPFLALKTVVWSLDSTHFGKVIVVYYTQKYLAGRG